MPSCTVRNVQISHRQSERGPQSIRCALPSQPDKNRQAVGARAYRYRRRVAYLSFFFKFQEQGMRGPVCPIGSRESDIGEKRQTGNNIQAGRPMKPLMVAALLSALSTVALAKTTPIERLPDISKNMVSTETMQESTASIGAMREREYFEPSQSPVNAFPCRLEPILFDKVRLAQSCRLK